MTLWSQSGQFHDLIFDHVRIGYLVEDHKVFLSCSMHMELSEIEDCRDDALHMGRNILDTRDPELVCFSDEETLLLNIDDPLVCDNPDIEVVINPDEKAKEPEENEEGVLDKQGKREVFRAHEFREKEGNDEVASHEKGRQKNNDQEMEKDIEPVAVDDREDLFSFVLAGEAKFMEIHPVRVLSKRMTDEN